MSKETDLLVNEWCYFFAENEAPGRILQRVGDGVYLMYLYEDETDSEDRRGFACLFSVQKMQEWGFNFYATRSERDEDLTMRRIYRVNDMRLELQSVPQKQREPILRALGENS